MALQDSSNHFYPPNRACPTMTLLSSLYVFSPLDFPTFMKSKSDSLKKMKKTMKIQEILIAADGDIKSKFLPSDVYYDHVKITVSRRHRRVEIGG